MLMLKLLRTYLLPYRKLLFAVLGFQFVQTIMTLLLPTLNADLINNGVAKEDTDYILHLGTHHARPHARPGCVRDHRDLLRCARGDELRPRRARAPCSASVTAFSAADVNTFGASSLITRITNDVQQVQMLVVMICTLFVAAPIMIVGGLFFAIREDGPLSLILVVAIPALACGIGLVVIRLIPQFENMQNRIDRTNQVLREQITGIRVIRAFVREPEEGERFGIANADLTESSLAAGRLQAFMFPTVMLVLNVSSVAAVWFGADRVASGDMQIGTLIAFLTYLIQILTATMMATFVAVMWPRAAVCAARGQGSARHAAERRPPPRLRCSRCRCGRRSRCATCTSATPAPRSRSSTTSPSGSTPASPSRWWAAPARARRRSSGSARASTTRPEAPCW